MISSTSVKINGIFNKIQMQILYTYEGIGNVVLLIIVFCRNYYKCI